MPLSLKEALRLGTMQFESLGFADFWLHCESEFADREKLLQLDNIDANQPTPLTGNFSLDLFHRRKRMLKLYYSQNLTTITIRKFAKQLTEQYKDAGFDTVVTEVALEKDWDRRRDWEPLIWAAVDARQDAEVLIRMLQFPREKALALIDGASNDSAKVGAIRAFGENVKLEIELRQSTGSLPKVKTEPAVNVEVNVKSEQHMLLKEYAQAIEEAAAINGDFSDVRSGEQVDSGQAAPVDRPKRANS